MANKLIVSLSPHVHSGDSVQKNMYGVLIALIPALLVSFYMFGLGAVVVTLTSVAACVFFEWAITKFILKRERSTICDGSAVITGVYLPADFFSCADDFMAVGSTMGKLYRCSDRSYSAGSNENGSQR